MPLLNRSDNTQTLQLKNSTSAPTTFELFRTKSDVSAKYAVQIKNIPFPIPLIEHLSEYCLSIKKQLSSNHQPLQQYAIHL